MHTLRTSTSLHFMLAIAVSFVLSISLAAAASITGLMPEARVDPHKAPFWTPLTDHLRHAATINGAASERRAPSGQQDATASAPASATPLRAGL